MKQVLIVDDHVMVRKGLMVICQTQFGIKDIDEASSCNGLMVALKKKDYTHAIIDLVLTDGTTLEIIPNIRRLYPDLKILVFSMQAFGMYRATLEKYGIRSFISKGAPEKETIRQLQDFLYNDNDTPRSHSAVKTALDKFTPREIEVMHYLLQGKGSNEIATTLNMKQNTVSTFKKRIFEKSNTKTVIELKEWIELNQDL